MAQNQTPEERISEVARGLVEFARQCARLAGMLDDNIVVIGDDFTGDVATLAQIVGKSKSEQDLLLIESVMLGAFYLGTHITGGEIANALKRREALNRAANMRERKASKRPTIERRNEVILKHALIFTKGKPLIREKARALAGKITESVVAELGAKYDQATIATYLRDLIDGISAKKSS